MPAAIPIQPYAGNVPAHAVAPVGFTFDLARKRRVHPFLETIGGIVASTEPIPENLPDATGLNFFFDFGGRIRWRALERSFNPSVDNNVFYVGYSFLR